jgi:hypothetical protein
MRKLVLVLLGCFLVSACVTANIPSQEYALAKAAQEAAVTAEAIKFAPQFYYKSEKSFKKAEQLFKERYYEEARQEFLISKKLAERAETTARLKQFNSAGEGYD